MAFATKYRYEFQQAVLTKPDQVRAWYRVSFLFDGYAGAVIEVVAGETPLIIELSDSSDSIFEPIRPQTYTFALACEEYWQAQDFYVKSNREIQVLIEQDITGTKANYQTLRTGWVDPSDMKEPYQPKPYPVEITGACGLASLKDRLLLDQFGNRLTGMVSVSEVIRTALKHTDISNNLITGVNLFDLSDVIGNQVVNGLAQINKDPLYQKVIHAEAFLTDSLDTGTCWDALMLVLGENLQLTQHNGLWYVIRVGEQAGGWDPWNGQNASTVHTRGHYSVNAYDPPTPGFDQSVDSTVLSGKNEALRAIMDACTYWKQPVLPGVRVEQVFGRKLSGFVNGEMVSVDNTNLPTGWLTQHVVTTSRYRTGTGTDSDPYRLVILGAGDEKFTPTTPMVATYADYTVDDDEYKKFTTRRLKGKFRLTNCRAAKLIIVAQRDDGSYLRTNDDWVRFDKLKKADAKGILIYNTHKKIMYESVTYQKDVTNAGIADIDIDLGTIDRVLKLVIGFGMGEALDKHNSSGKVIGPEQGPPQPKVEYWPVYLEVEEAGLTLDGMHQIVVDGSKTVTDTTHTIFLGDVPPIAQPVLRVGASFRRANLPTLTPTTLLFKPDANPSAVGNSITGGNTQLGWVTKERAKQAMLGPMTFEGTLTGPMPYGPLSVLVVTDLSALGRALITRWHWEPLLSTHELTAQQIMASAPDNALPTVKKEWETPNGTIPQSEGEDGTPVSPNAKPFVSKKAELLKQLKDFGLIKPSLGVSPVQPGFSPLDSKGKLSATIHIGTVLKGSVVSQLRKQIKLTFPQ